jgi:hypothetical protein
MKDQDRRIYFLISALVVCETLSKTCTFDTYGFPTFFGEEAMWQCTAYDINISANDYGYFSGKCCPLNSSGGTCTGEYEGFIVKYYSGGYVDLDNSGDMAIKRATEVSGGFRCNKKGSGKVYCLGATTIATNKIYIMTFTGSNVEVLQSVEITGHIDFEEGGADLVSPDDIHAYFTFV